MLSSFTTTPFYKSATTLGTKTLHLAYYPKLEAYLPDFPSFARAKRVLRSGGRPRQMYIAIDNSEAVRAGTE